MRIEHKPGVMTATTILAVRRGDDVAMAGDGQVTVGESVMKHNARKVRTLANGAVLVGFAGTTADALTLFERFEAMIERYQGNLRRAAVELTKEWRKDKFLRRLEAQLLVAGRGEILVLTGDGDVIEPDEGVAAIGSGGIYAQAAAQALLRHTTLSASEIARAAMEIAAAMCIYTNDHILLYTLDAPSAESASNGASNGASDRHHDRPAPDRATTALGAHGEHDHETTH